MLFFKLDEIMDEKGLSINKVSSETKISRPSITAMYNNESKGVQLDTLEKLMDYLKVPLNDLIGEKNNEYIFEFKSEYTKNDLLALKKENKNKNTSLSELAPPEVLSYEARILMNGQQKGEAFKFMIIPGGKSIGEIDGLELIMGIFIRFYRLDSDNKEKDISDIDQFLNRLNTEAAKKIVQKIFNSWFDLYRHNEKKGTPILSEFLAFALTGSSNKKPISIITNTDMSQKNILDFKMFDKFSELNGDDTFSSSLEFKEIPADN